MDNEKITIMIFFKPKFGKGCIPDSLDLRDLTYDEIAFGVDIIDWETGCDIEKKLNIKIPIKNQDGSSSCVGQGWAYYTSVVNTVETGKYEEVSAKAIYSQIALSGGGAYIRDGGKLIVDWGAVKETIVPSYDNGKPPKEDFVLDKSWKNENIDKLAKILQAKEYRTISASNSMDLFAHAILINNGVVSGVNGQDNGTWYSNEPKPPTKTEWGHCLYFGKFGIDELGKYIATPNSWGVRKQDELHPDGWQKLREDYFISGNVFNPWTLIDKPNMDIETQNLVKNNEKKLIMEGEGLGRIGIIINGKLRIISQERSAQAALYTLINNKYGQTIPSKLFDEIEKDQPF